MDPSSTGNDRRSELNGTAAAVLVITLLSITLRFWSRKTSKGAGLWWDDWLALASVPFLIALSALIFYGTTVGLGLPADQAPGNFDAWWKIIYSENGLYNTGLSCVKMSVVLFYFRVFGHVKKYRIAFWVSAALVIAWCIGINLMAYFQCTPVSAAWNRNTPGNCTPVAATFLSTSVTNIIVDLVILLVPMPGVWCLHTSTARKIALSGAFACGYCVIIISIVRLVTIVRFNYFEGADFVEASITPQIIFMLEPPIALFSACLPAMFQLLKGFCQRMGLVSTTSNLTPFSHRTHKSTLVDPADHQAGGSAFEQLPEHDASLDSQERLYTGAETYPLKDVNETTSIRSSK